LLLSVILIQLGASTDTDASIIAAHRRAILVCPAARVLFVDAWLARKRARSLSERVPAWPRYLLILQLYGCILSAHNRATPLVSWAAFPAVSKCSAIRILRALAPGTFRSAYRLTQLGYRRKTMLFEGSAPLMLLWLWRGWRVVGGVFGCARSSTPSRHRLTMQLGISPRMIRPVSDFLS